jgi:hypothetical protein
MHSVTAAMARQRNLRRKPLSEKMRPHRFPFLPRTFEAYIPTIDLTASRTKHGVGLQPLQNLGKSRHDHLVYILIIRALDRFI